jgi:c-di-GMP-binding flagellar brake protein YcgR
MSSSVEFVVNKKMEIELEDGAYKCNVQDITDEYIGISIPVNNGKYLPLRTGEQVRGVYYCDNNVYRFTTVVIGRKIEKILIIMLKKPEKVVMVQRRTYVRVPLMINVYCALMSVEKGIYNVSDNQIDFFEGYSLDISGGGMKIAVDRKLEKKIIFGNILLITIPLKDETLTVRGKIMRIDNDRSNPKIVCGLNFIDLDKKARETIIALVFQIMREQMKVGVKGD